MSLIERDQDGIWWIHVWLVGPFVLALCLMAVGAVALIGWVFG